MHDDFYFRLGRIGGTGRTDMYRDYLERLKEGKKQSGSRGGSSPDIKRDIGLCAYSAAIKIRLLST
ncbi:hypothetical protein ABDB91_19030 [Desulfoscipio sp. XC116]|uniref:hypothetical protein n=1 Tax=Desulfoscipio sp. XC116 TaxID=3144975 RepID=UPI00325B2145